MCRVWSRHGECGVLVGVWGKVCVCVCRVGREEMEEVGLGRCGGCTGKGVRVWGT